MISGREKFGAFVRREREAKGLSLRDMAKKIKVSPAFLQRSRPRIGSRERTSCGKLLKSSAATLMISWHGRVGFQRNCPRSSSKARIVIK